MWFFCSALAIAALIAETPAGSLPNTNPLPDGVNPEQWPRDFNPQTREQHVETDTSTDQDVIIMEGDEDSENLPGNPENPTQ